MAFYLMKCSASYIGTDAYYKFEADDLESAHEVARDLAYEHVEQFEDIQTWEEENEVEYELNYTVAEVTEEEYQEAEHDER